MATTCSGLILAGGQSRRMPGVNKALAALNGRPMIAHVLNALGACFETLALVAKDKATYAGLGVPVVEDRLPVQSPLAGIHAGLDAVSSDYVFCCACDTPLLKPSLIQTLVDVVVPDSGEIPSPDVVVPRLGPYYQPLCAIYGRGCLPAIEALLDAGEVKVDHLYARVNVTEVSEDRLRQADPELHSFFNVNTPADLQSAAELLGKSR